MPASGSIPKSVRRRVIERDGMRCRYCNIKVKSRKKGHIGKPPPYSLTLDHVTPVSLGGKSTDDNLVVCCYWCNAAKMNRVDTPRLLLREIYAAREKQQSTTDE